MKKGIPFVFLIQESQEEGVWSVWLAIWKGVLSLLCIHEMLSDLD